MQVYGDGYIAENACTDVNAQVEGGNVYENVKVFGGAKVCSQIFGNVQVCENAKVDHLENGSL